MFIRISRKGRATSIYAKREDGIYEPIWAENDMFDVLTEIMVQVYLTTYRGTKFEVP